MSQNEFCVICAKTDELRELLGVFMTRFRSIRGKQLTDRVFVLPKSDMKVRATTCNAMGHMSAAVRTAQMITTEQPGLLIFVGTAASLKPDLVQIGDVVIPRKAVFRQYDKISESGQKDYQLREALGGFKEFFFGENALISDLSTADASPDACDAVASLDIANLGLESGPDGEITVGGHSHMLRSPMVHDDVDIFSCGMVIDSVSYREFVTRSAEEHLRKIAIVDMESYGFFKAIEAAKGSGVGTPCAGIMIRGISDYAGRKSETETRPEGWKEKSVRNAAIVTAQLLESLDNVAVSEAA